jgi:hypothetical protein
MAKTAQGRLAIRPCQGDGVAGRARQR